MQIKWKTEKTLVRWLFQVQPDLGLHCLNMPVGPQNYAYLHLTKILQPGVKLWVGKKVAPLAKKFILPLPSRRSEITFLELPNNQDLGLTLQIVEICIICLFTSA